MDTTAFSSKNAFANEEAQDFAFELRPSGSEPIREVLDKKGRSSDAHAKRVIAAGETVAAANGYPPTETGMRR